LKGCKASLSFQTIRQILLDTARPVPDLSGRAATGGVVDYAAAINDRRAAGKRYCDPAPSNVAPVANAGGVYAGNYRQPVQFNGSGSYDSDGQIFIYFWDFGDGTTGLGSTPTHQYATGGVYTVRLTVRDNLGGMSSRVTTATMRPAKH
jgi:chitodextrinase